MSKAIKQQLEAMPLEEFEDLLKGAANNRHAGRPQHGELITQLKNDSKVQPDEPFQKTDEEWSTIRKPFPRKEKSGASAGATVNGNTLHSGTHLPDLHHNKDFISVTKSTNRSASNARDQNANPVASSSNSSTSDYTSSSYRTHSPIRNSAQGKYPLVNNHPLYTNKFNNNHSLDGDLASLLNKRGQDRDSGAPSLDCKSSSSGSSGKFNSNETSKAKDEDDDDTEETYLDSDNFTGGLPSQYILPGLTKFNATSKDLPMQMFGGKPPNALSSITGLDGSAIGHQSTSSSYLTNSVNSNSLGELDHHDDQPGTSRAPVWDPRQRRNDSVQLKDYRSVTSVTSGTCTAPSYYGKSTVSASEETYGTVQAASPTLPSSSLTSKSPTGEGSQLAVSTAGRRGTDRKKKTPKNVLRETIYNTNDVPGHLGTVVDVDKLCDYISGNQKEDKSKRAPKEKKQKETKPTKSNEKQVLSKAASLDENTLGYGSKKSIEEETNGAKNLPSSSVEKKNTANITKSANAICDDNQSSINTSGFDMKPKSIGPSQCEPNASLNIIPVSASKGTVSNQPLVNGATGSHAPKPMRAKDVASSTKASVLKTEPNTTSTKGTQECKESESKFSQQLVAPDQIQPSHVVAIANQPAIVGPKLKNAATLTKQRSDEEKGARQDEDGPYVLVQSKKKREKKKQQRESENFTRSHQDQSRREGVRPRRGNAERRKSVGSVPGSENSECSDDDDSVRSLPAGECTPKERIPKPCSSSGGTPQTSYADIARMSKDENTKIASPTSVVVAPAPVLSAPVPKTPVQNPKPAPSISTPVTTPEDVHFPALSPLTSEKTATTANTAVWPCRPRNIDTDLSATQEKMDMSISSNNNGEEPSSNAPSIINDNDASFPPVSANLATGQIIKTSTDSQKCSIDRSININNNNNNKSVVSPDTILKINNNNINNTITKDLASPLSQILDTPPVYRSEFVAQNGIVTRTPEKITPKSIPSVKFRSEEKKTKDKVLKGISDEVKPLSVHKAASENGDLCPSKPVVFCGGQFDTTRMPVGQKTGFGFEFGFGVIEVLNISKDTCPAQPSLPGPKSTEPMFVSSSGEDPVPKQTAPRKHSSRSQETKEMNHVDGGSVSKSDTTKRDVSQVKFQEKHESKLQKNNGKNKGQASFFSTNSESSSLPRAISGDSVPVSKQTLSSGYSTNVTVAGSPSAPPSSTWIQPVPLQKPSATLSSASATFPSEKSVATSLPSGTSAPGPNKDRDTKSTNIDVAQAFSYPTDLAVPECNSHQVALNYEYFDRKTSLAKDGKLTYHHIA